MPPKQKTARDKKYLAWLRTLACVFCGRTEPSEVSHHGQRGFGMKASDYKALPACQRCHRRWHDKGSPHEEWDDMDRYAKRERFAQLATTYRDRYTNGGRDDPTE